MFGLLIMAVIVGGITSVVTGIGFLFWPVSAVIFICGLPWALISSFVDGAIDRAQDRTDYREVMAQLAHEEAEERRTEKLVSAIQKQHSPITDNRQIHIYGGRT